MELELPFPPSVNHYWRLVGNRMLLRRDGRDYRRAVRAVLSARCVRPTAGRLAITIDVCPPSRRRRGIDDVLKVLLDALQYSSAAVDAAKVDDLHIRRGACAPGGRVCVRLMPQSQPGATDPDAKPRSCLKCGELFISAGPGNRICQPCSRDNDKLRLTEQELQAQRGAKRHNGGDLPPDAQLDEAPPW